MRCHQSGAVVLHRMHDRLPLAADPSTGVTAVGPGAVAEPDGADLRGPSVEGGVTGFLAALRTRLHAATVPRVSPVVARATGPRVDVRHVAKFAWTLASRHVEPDP